MDKTTITVCAAVGSLGVLSAIFAFSAEGTKLTPYTILVYGDDCIYPQNPALGLGICAVIFFLVAQVTISAVGGCCGCCRSRSVPSETKRIVGIVCAVFSWIAAVIAWALLIEGAAWNANVVREEEAPFCPYLKDGIFAGAGILALAATALGLASYVMMRTPPPETAAVLPVPAKGEPQFTAPTAAADQSNNGSHAPDQQDSSPQAPPSNVAPPPEAVASAPPFPQVGLDVPVSLPPPTTPSAANGGQPGLSTVVRDEVTRQGIRLAVKDSPPQSQAPPSNAGLQVAVASVTHEEPSELPGPLQVSQPQPPQPYVPNQYDMPVQFPQVGLDVLAPLPPLTATTSAGSGQQGLSTVVRNEVAKQGIRLAAKVVEHSLFSDDN
ncbi:unnamed protein product [Urochloa decumbens]|uniref:Uncharacterized protein n=1 Tax=Urochloa decumbens TaxID=240449 RepID=A0ABC8VMG7_9POAL